MSEPAWEQIGAVVAGQPMIPYLCDRHHIYRIVSGDEIHAPHIRARRAGLLVRRPAVPMPDPKANVGDRPVRHDIRREYL